MSAVSRSQPDQTNEKPYGPANERVARAEIDGDLATIYNFRRSRYPAIDEAEVHWTDEVFDLRELTNLWLIFGQFSKFHGIAHLEMAFEFADNNNAVASFEIRPRKGEYYSIKAGFKKTFPITLRWASESDMFLRRVMRSNPDSKMYMYEADITHSLMINLFHAAAKRTNDLLETPEWYHTANNACAGNALDLAVEILPDHIKRSRRVAFPGLMAKKWANDGLIKLDGTFEETKTKAFINDRCLEIGDVDDFSAQLHGRS